MGGHGKSKAHIHARRITFYRRIDITFDPGEVNHLIKLPFDLRFAHAQYRPVQKNIFAPGELRVKAGAHLQQTGYAAFDFYGSGGWGCYAAKNLEQGAFAGAI